MDIPQYMKAISLQSPWWWYILYAGKDIENRGLRFPRWYRGRILLHVSKWFQIDEIKWSIEDAQVMSAHQPVLTEGAPIPTLEYMKELRGCIVGSVDIVDYVTESNSPWFVGPLGIVLANPIPFVNPIPYKGALGIFKVDVSTAAMQAEIEPLFRKAA